MKSILNVLIAFLAIFLTPALGSAVTHIVTQEGLTFNPSDITIGAGDTIEWVWTGGSHTVTSGTNLSDPEVGQLFDVPFTSSNQSVTYTFTIVGTQDYFCRPHLSFGMTGSVTVTAVTPVDDNPGRPTIQLLPNVPNPFNPTTRITFDLPTDRAGSVDVSLRIYDLRGRLVRNLLEETVTVDRRTVVWDGRNSQGRTAPSGVYVYRLVAAGKTLSRTMTLAK